MIRPRGLFYNALLKKELRTRTRGWRSTAVLTFYMAILGVIAIAFLWMQAGPTTGQSSQVGVQLFQVLSVFQLFLILFITPASTAGALSGERQRQTWDLLLVTRLPSFGIVWGKLVAGLAFNLMLIFASLPLFSLVFLFGGVAPEDVVHTYLVFLTTVLLLGMLSLFVSSLTRRLAVSMIVSNILALFLGVGLSLLTLYLESYQQPGLIAGPPGFGNNGPATAPLTPLAQLDPFVALLSALPTGTGGSALGSLGTIYHAFGLPLRMQLWDAYAILAAELSLLLLLLTAVVVRFPFSWRIVRSSRRPSRDDSA
jgi:ABC-type transport system involved in multi-copper enzyme maturation permease subunit